MLESRLQLAFDNLKPNWDVWDFCCDHGLLGMEALRIFESSESSLYSDSLKSTQVKSFGKVYFADQVPHIIKALEAKLSQKYSLDKYQTYVSDLRVDKFDAPPQGNLLFLGIGAKSMVEMLKCQVPQVSDKIRLILCPNKNSEELRFYLKNQGWKLKSNQLIEDKRSVRDFLVCESQGEEIELFGNDLVKDESYRKYIKSQKKYYSYKINPNQFENECIKLLGQMKL